MPDFSGIQGGNAETLGATTASSTGTLVTCSASANTKGSYAQLTATTAYPSAWILVTINNPNVANTFLVDIAVGAAASEQVILSNLMYGTNSNTKLCAYQYLFPVSIPAGTRVSARAQCEVAGSRTIVVHAVLLDATMMSSCPMGVVTTFGATTATSFGTAIDPGGTANTKGSYVQFSASTPYPIRWLGMAQGNASGSAAAEMEWLLDIAVGAAASEQVILSNLYLATSTTNDTPFPLTTMIPVNIPAGVRLSARCQCSVNTATERLLDTILYGVS